VLHRPRAAGGSAKLPSSNEEGPTRKRQGWYSGGGDRSRRCLLKIKIAPSILSADFTRLGEQVQAVEAAGVDRIQVDVMDGRFVPNITFGAIALRSLRPLTRLTMEAHMMVTPPENFIETFAAAGADTIIVHQESTPHLHRVLEHIHHLGKKPAVALNPSTPMSTLSEVLEMVKLVLVMTVNPGFGGQKFIHSTLHKVRQVRAALEERGLDCEVEVDGGINENTIGLAAAAGADVMVAGSSVYDAPEGVGPGIAHLLACATVS
jgi:ribulose-phosphate 3-epimerase